MWPGGRVFETAAICRFTENYRFPSSRLTLWLYMAEFKVFARFSISNYRRLQEGVVISFHILAYILSNEQILPPIRTVAHAYRKTSAVSEINTIAFWLLLPIKPYILVSAIVWPVPSRCVKLYCIASKCVRDTNFAETFRLAYNIYVGNFIPFHTGSSFNKPNPVPFYSVSFSASPVWYCFVSVPGITVSK